MTVMVSVGEGDEADNLSVDFTNNYFEMFLDAAPDTSGEMRGMSPGEVYKTDRLLRLMEQLEAYHTEDPILNEMAKDMLAICKAARDQGMPVEIT